MKHNILVKSDGIYLIEMPESPYGLPSLELAKAKAVKIADQERIKKELPLDAWGRGPSDPWYNPDTIIPIDLPGEFEVRWQIKNVKDEWVDIQHVPENTDPDTAWPENRQLAYYTILWK
jgi:hypothetical protein